MAVVVGMLGACLCAQATPKPGSASVITVPEPGATERTVRVHGYTPNHYLARGRYPLVVVLGDKSLSGDAAIRTLPHAVVDRMRMVVVSPSLGTADYDAAGYDRVLALMPALIDAVGNTWSIDERRVFVYGVGGAAPIALALGRDLEKQLVAAAALAPKASAVPGRTRPGKLPALIVTAGGKHKVIADELLQAVNGMLKVALTEREEVGQGQGEAVVQPLLEWFLEFTLEKPKQDIDRVKGRTMAAQGSKNRVLCITGDYDSVEDVLTKLEIPHLVMSWQQFANFDLSETDVLLINCDSGTAYGAVRAKVDKRLRDFVQKGGYLFATDWALQWPVAEVFGDHVRHLDPQTPEMLVDVRPTAQALHHELLQNVFPLDQPLPRWQVDAGSYLVDVRKPARCEVLLESEELGAAHGGNRILGATFRIGTYGGLVLNVVSHFSHQCDGTPTTPMYQLIVNFINAAKRSRDSRR